MVLVISQHNLPKPSTDLARAMMFPALKLSLHGFQPRDHSLLRRDSPDDESSVGELPAEVGEAQEFHVRLVYVKKAPFCSRPSTEIKFLLGSGISDSKRNPGCSADHLIVAPVLKNEPLKP